MRRTLIMAAVCALLLAAASSIAQAKDTACLTGTDSDTGQTVTFNLTASDSSNGSFAGWISGPMVIESDSTTETYTVSGTDGGDSDFSFYRTYSLFGSRYSSDDVVYTASITLIFYFNSGTDTSTSTLTYGEYFGATSYNASDTSTADYVLTNYSGDLKLCD